MSSSVNYKTRNIRFTGSPTKEKSYVRDGYGHDIGWELSGAHDSLRDIVNGDSPNYHFKLAKYELQNVMINSNKTAWDDLVSFYHYEKEREIEHRNKLKEKYYNTDLWDHIKDRWSLIDIDTTAILRSLIRLYTTDYFYAYLNNCFRTRQTHRYKGYAVLLATRAHFVVPYFMEKKVFRGMEIQDLESYEEGLIYRWPFFVSASANEGIAKNFGPVLFVINIHEKFSIMDISSYSLHPYEEEVLFLPYTRFEVLEKKYDRIIVEICTKGSDFAQL